MVTHREVLMQVRRVGIKKVSRIKENCGEFEQSMAVKYDDEVAEKERLDPQAGSLRSPSAGIACGWSNPSGHI